MNVQEKPQTASDPVGAKLNPLVAHPDLEKAEKVIDSESVIFLTRRESLRLLEIIQNSPPRNKKFIQGQARYQRLKIDSGFTA